MLLLTCSVMTKKSVMSVNRFTCWANCVEIKGKNERRKCTPFSSTRAFFFNEYVICDSEYVIGLGVCVPQLESYLNTTFLLLNVECPVIFAQFCVCIYIYVCVYIYIYTSYCKNISDDPCSYLTLSWLWYQGTSNVGVNKAWGSISTMPTSYLFSL
jgi:hypothetical protein